MELLLSALCLVLVIEALLPFIAPSTWRRTLAELSQLSDRQIRIGALVAMVIGLVGLKLLRGA
jgi:uncharacterized protein